MQMGGGFSGESIQWKRVISLHSHSHMVEFIVVPKTTVSDWKIQCSMAYSLEIGANLSVDMDNDVLMENVCWLLRRISIEEWSYFLI